MAIFKKNTTTLKDNEKINDKLEAKNDEAKELSLEDLDEVAGGKFMRPTNNDIRKA